MVKRKEKQKKQQKRNRSSKTDHERTMLNTFQEIKDRLENEYVESEISALNNLLHLRVNQIQINQYKTLLLKLKTQKMGLKAD